MSPGNTVRQVKIIECHGFLRMLEFNLSDCRFQVPQESKAMELVLPCGLRKSKPARDMLFLSLRHIFYPGAEYPIRLQMI